MKNYFVMTLYVFCLNSPKILQNLNAFQRFIFSMLCEIDLILIVYTLQSFSLFQPSIKAAAAQRESARHQKMIGVCFCRYRTKLLNCWQNSSSEACSRVFQASIHSPLPQTSALILICDPLRAERKHSASLSHLQCESPALTHVQWHSDGASSESFICKLIGWWWNSWCH